MTDGPDLQPVFPLPNVVLFPRALLPLHVFEPRYRTMMADVLDGGRTLCVALLKPGWERDYYGTPDVFPAACVGRVVQHQQLPDGRYNVVLQGEAKVLLDGFERQVPYRIARVRPIDEDTSWAQDSEAEATARQLMELYRRLQHRQGTAIDPEQILGPQAGVETVVNTIAMNLDVDPGVRQQLLELDRLELRARALRRLLRGSGRTQTILDRFRHLQPPDLRRN